MLTIKSSRIVFFKIYLNNTLLVIIEKSHIFFLHYSYESFDSHNQGFRNIKTKIYFLSKRF